MSSFFLSILLVILGHANSVEDGLLDVVLSVQ